MDISGLHDDEIVAEMQRRLDRGTVGYHGLYASNQQDYRNMWWSLSELVNELRNKKFDDFYLTIIKNRMNDLASEAPQAPKPYSINTTFLGKEDIYQNHSPE